MGGYLTDGWDETKPPAARLRCCSDRGQPRHSLPAGGHVPWQLRL